MLIREVYLDNIRTYRNTTIKFRPGVNLLHGPNGAGKSTILVMIGYVLFNHGVGKDAYLRNDVNAEVAKGTVHVIIETKDKKLYKIVRILTKGTNVPKVYEKKGKSWVFISNIQKVSSYQEWFKSLIGLEDMDLSKFFEQAVGVPQGSFISPFTLADQKRKEAFSPLLGIEDYKKIYTKTVFLENKLKEEENEIEKEIKRIEGKLERRESLWREIHTLEKEIKNLNNKKNKVEEEAKEVIENLKKLKALSDEITTKDMKLQSIKNSIKSYEEKLEETIRQIKLGEEAKRKVEENKANYEKYEQLHVDSLKLRKKIRDLEKISKKRQKLEKRISTLEGKITVTAKKIETLTEKIPDYKRLEKKKNEYMSLEKEEKEVMGKIKELKEQARQLNSFKRKKKELEGKIVNIENQLSLLPPLLEKKDALKKAQEELNLVKNQLSAQQSELKRLKKNKKLSKGGKCPLLLEQCKNIEGGSLELYFEQEINKLIPEIEKLKKKEEALNKKLEELAEVEKKIETLRRYEGELNALRERLETTEKEIMELQKKIVSLSELEKKHREMKEKLALLKKDYEDFMALRDSIEVDLPKLKDTHRELLEEQNQLSKDLVVLREKEKELDRLNQKSMQIESELEKLEKSHKIYLENRDRSESLESWKIKKRNTEEKLRSLREESQKLITSLEQLKSLYDEEKHRELEEKKRVIDEQLGRLEGIINEKRNLLVKNKKELKELDQLAVTLDEQKEILQDLKNMEELAKTIRSLFNTLPEDLAKVMVKEISKSANQFFMDIMGDPSLNLEWTETFEILISKVGQQKRSFSQLSGGEQMSAAIAVRLAILRYLSNISFAFFDEPTPHLDSDKRENLAKEIANIKGFEQLFVISHDDTFASHVDHLVHLEKTSDGITEVTYR